MEKKVSKNDNNYNQLAFALEILKLLSEKPHKREDLAARLSNFLEQHEKPAEDILQKLTRAIRKLRDCGFEIRSAPNRPYELIESSFPVILSTEQRQALALAAYFLTDMGFSTQASQIIRIGKLTEADLPTDVKVNFSPPIDYSEDKLEETVGKLQERFRQQCRYAILYQSASGNKKTWDCDRSELRLHNGVLYLFAYTADFSPRHHTVERNQAFRIDRILRVYPSSQTPWQTLYFPTLAIRYRMSGPLGTYKPRRANEHEIWRDPQANVVEIEAHEDYVFGFQQRIFQYGENVQVLEPEWLVQIIQQRLQKAASNYTKDSGIADLKYEI